MQALVRWMLVAMLLASTVQAQNTDEQEPESRGQLYERVGKIIGAFQSLGNWDEHYGYMMDSVESVYDRQGWDSESDMFSLDLVRTVESIPPWEVRRRFDTMMEVFSDRYLLDEGQERMMRRKFIRMSNSMFQKHSGRIMQYATEAIQTRAMGDEFTPEQVQRWVRLAEPVFQDARLRLNESAAELMQELDPEQREILSRDLAAANHRMGTIEKLSEEWKRGNWKPADWGMENDPIQLAAESRRIEEDAAKDRAAAVAEQARNPKRTPPDANPRVGDSKPAVRSKGPVQPKGDTDAWTVYVRAFIERYKLNDGQRTRAWLIHKDVLNRRDQLNKRHEKQLGGVVKRGGVASDAATSLRIKHQALLERLFSQMERRLGRLPTRAQRKETAKTPLPVPAEIQALRK